MSSMSSQPSKTSRHRVPGWGQRCCGSPVRGAGGGSPLEMSAVGIPPLLNGGVRKGRFSAQRENASRRLVQGQLERQVCQDVQVSGHKLCRSVPWMVTLRWGLWMCIGGELQYASSRDTHTRK